MNNQIQQSISRIALLTAALLAGALTGCRTGTQSKSPPTLKAAYKHHFYVGVAINRTIVTGATDQTNEFFSRPREQVDKDIALVKQEFDQISPENDLKWEMIQPYEGPNGYDFGAADAYVNFGISNHMYI